MFAVSHFILAIARLLELVLWAYFWIIIARAVISWVSPDPFNPIVRFLYRITEPVLRPIRRRLPMFQMGLDLSPMIVILAIYFLQSFLVESLRDLAVSLR
jgi:YggT family protein